MPSTCKLKEWVWVFRLGPLWQTFSEFRETIWLFEWPSSFRSMFHKRYVDELYILFKIRGDSVLSLDKTNISHSNINFLDYCIQLFRNKFISSVFRKPIFFGLVICFCSFCSFSFKTNVIETQLFRAYKLSSYYHLMHIEYDFLRKFFVNNGFPLHLVQSQIRNFLPKLFTQNVP